MYKINRIFDKKYKSKFKSGIKNISIEKKMSELVSEYGDMTVKILNIDIKEISDFMEILNKFIDLGGIKNSKNNKKEYFMIRFLQCFILSAIGDQESLEMILNIDKYKDKINYGLTMQQVDENTLKLAVYKPSIM